MAISDLISSFRSDKKALTAVTVLGAAGLCLILISSFLPGDNEKEENQQESVSVYADAESYRSETEKRLAEFLEDIEGVGEVRVYLTVSGNEEYVYATEGKSSVSDDKEEEEHTYVMIGSSGSKSALVETVNSPEITGAVIACSGGSSAAVQEEIYNAVSTALGISTGKIYVTKLR
jgi:stage III sporulation protein AG